jgi:hypothetical protein
MGTLGEGQEIRRGGQLANQSWLGKQLRAGIRLIESMIRKSERSYEFCDDPDCVLRIQLMPSPRQVTLGEKLIMEDDLVLAIHVWNERMPPIPSGGADLKWALHLRRLVLHSYKLLARVMQDDTTYKPVRAIYGSSALFSSTNHTGGKRMMQGFGFTILPYHSPLGKFGEFWENLFSWWLMYAYNTASMESRKFWQLERTEIWMDRDEFIHRYGEQVSPES